MNFTIVYLKCSGVVKFEVLTVLTELATVLCHVTSCSSAKFYGAQPIFYPKMEAMHLSETSENFHQFV
jgi:hypothetical protein